MNYCFYLDEMVVAGRRLLDGIEVDCDTLASRCDQRCVRQVQQ